jgi:hypothetical protein
MNYKDTKPYMSSFLSVDLKTEFAAFCLTDFIDWRYTHSWFVFSTQLMNCCPPWMKELNLCTVAPAFVAGGGHTRRAERGMGVNILEDERNRIALLQ